MKNRAKFLRLPRLTHLTVTLILGWADDHLHKVGKYPSAKPSPVLSPDAPLAMTWRKVDIALRRGYFGLAGRNSLAKVLEKHRGIRNRSDLPRLTDETILAWADQHHNRTGKWPTENAGPILGTNGEDWQNINAALREGIRGLKGGRTLPRLIAKGRNVRNKTVVPKLSIRKILKMAHTHHKVTGKWPKVFDGPVAGFQGETWLAVNSALATGGRGLPGGSSLAQVLREHRILSPKTLRKEEPADTWYVYLLRCRDGSLYTGITKDLHRRCQKHNAGTASRYTRSRLPIRLVYQESHASRSLALKREAAIKAMTRQEKMAMIRVSTRVG